MFNLLVAYDSDTWQRKSTYELERSRFLEFTDEKISARFNSESALTHEQKAALMQLPCVFMSEDFKGPTRTGKLTSVSAKGRSIHINFELDDGPEIPEVEGLAEKFGMVGWELSRTHWAIKDIDLKALLQELVPQAPAEPEVMRAEPTSTVTVRDLPPAPLPEASSVNSVSDFIAKVLAIQKDGNEIFYRGHSNRRTYMPAPTLFRSKPGGVYPHLPVEHQLYRELLVANSKDFRDDRTTLDKLVRMQHYGLPTRLLDITSNPLIALFFACKSSERTRSGAGEQQEPTSNGLEATGSQEATAEIPGEVIIFKIEPSRIKYFDSDTASCIANLAQLMQTEKEQIDFSLDEVTAFNNQAVIKRLLHFIKEEKPYFEARLLKDDLRSVLCVKSKRSNDRISFQSGAFLLFGQDAKFYEGGMPEIGITIERLAIENKKAILVELDQLNINESTVFPNIESSAKYIAQRLSQG